MWRSGACVTRALLQAAPRARAAAGAGVMVAPPLAAARGVSMAARPAPTAVAQRAARLGAWLARPAGACRCARVGQRMRRCADTYAPASHVPQTELGRTAARFASGRTAAPMIAMGKGPRKGKGKDEEASVYKDTVNLPKTSFGATLPPPAAAAAGGFCVHVLPLPLAQPMARCARSRAPECAQLSGAAGACVRGAAGALQSV
jgi:hypothetical protein